MAPIDGGYGQASLALRGATALNPADLSGSVRCPTASDGTSMFPLAAAIAAPAVGALLYGWLHNRPSTVRVLDRFMYLAVPALVAWQVIPHAWAEYGLLTFLVMALGMPRPI